MNKTVAILGNASRTREHCPHDDQNVDVWAIGIHTFSHGKRITALLEMHQDVFTSDRWDKMPNADEYKQWLKEDRGIPVYMKQLDRAVPACVQYPMEEICSKYLEHLWLGGKRLEHFFGGTATYGIALALHLGYTRIEIYGIELSSRPEYDDERDGFFFWCGVANAHGVDVVAHERSRLFREIRY